MTFPVPDEALLDHIAVLGKTGSGKSNAAKVTAERLMDRGERICAIDPTGTWWGLRLSRTGKSASQYPIVIFGGQRGDIPLEATTGGAIAEIIATSSTSAIIDTRLISVGKRTEFFTAFAEALMQKMTGTLHLFIDEAHLFAPQGKVNDPKSGAMVSAANNLVSLGRGLGLRIFLLTQRPAKLHKDSLTQCETLVAMRVTHPLDIDAAEDWFGRGKRGRALAEEVVGQLPAMKTGDAVVYAPQLGVLKRERFPLVSTFDSGRARANDEARPLAPIDIGTVTEKLQVVATQAKANDPRALKVRIAELEREVRAKPVATAPDPKVIEAAEARGHAAGFEAGVEVGWRLAGEAITEALGRKPKSVKRPPAIAATKDATVPRAAPSPAPARVERQPVEPASDRPLAAERRPLSVLASVYPAGMTEAQWATATGLRRTGGTWSTYVSRLRTAGRIRKEGDLWLATENGFADLGDAPPAMPPPGPELVEFWCGKISGVGPMLRHLAGVWPRGLARDELAAQLGLAASGGTFSTYLSRLRTPGLITNENGEVRAADALMAA